MKRRLKPAEIELISFMLSRDPLCHRLGETLAEVLVAESGDKGFGGVRFIDEGSQRGGARSMGRTVGELQFDDEDGVPVVFWLTLDNLGQLFEFEWWRVDYSPLRRYPKPSELRPVEWIQLPRRK